MRAVRRALTMGQDLKKIEGLYDLLAREWAEAFSGEHEKKRSGAGKHPVISGGDRHVRIVLRRAYQSRIPEYF